eukprot:366492-Chlamydomonas_euryale.AAC.3
MLLNGFEESGPVSVHGAHAPCCPPSNNRQVRRVIRLLSHFVTWHKGGSQCMLAQASTASVWPPAPQVNARPSSRAEVALSSKSWKRASGMNQAAAEHRDATEHAAIGVGQTEGVIRLDRSKTSCAQPYMIHSRSCTAYLGPKVGRRRDEAMAHRAATPGRVVRPV